MSQGEFIRLTASDGHTLFAYRSMPKGRPKAAVVVIQEVFGVNHHIRAVCDGFAAQGYATIAPSLFDREEKRVELGYSEHELVRGRELRTAIGWEAPLLDVQAAVAAAEAYGRVGVVGYCWGGSVAWLAATRLNPACAVCYYGGQIIDFKDETALCPVLMHLGQRDQIITAEHAVAIRNAQPDIAICTYAAGHGFNCTERADYDPENAALALDRTLAFFANHLK